MVSSLVLLAVLAGAGCTPPAAVGTAQAQEKTMQIPEGAKEIYFGGGCFWCIEAQLEMYRGVIEVESGYAGGKPGKVTYREVGSGTTGHAETVKVVYDPGQVSTEDLLRLFFVVHDPTQLNRQGADVGTQYRSVLFYRDPEEKATMERILKEIEDEKVWPRPIVTTIEPLGEYTRAEDYHQDYWDKYSSASPAERMGMNAGYCANVIEPKVRKFREKFADKLKKG